MMDAIFWMSVGVLLSGCVSAVAQELIDGLALPSIDEMERDLEELR